MALAQRAVSKRTVPQTIGAVIRQTFTRYLSKRCLSNNIEEGYYSIDFHGVAKLRIEDIKHLAICTSFETERMLHFLSFLEEHDLRQFDVVSLSWEGKDEFRMLEYEHRLETLLDK